MSEDVFAVLGTYVPLLVFLLVTIVVFAVLVKTQILGKNTFIALAVAFLAGMILLTAEGARNYIASAAPWFVIFLVAIFFIFVIMAFAGKNVDFLRTGIGAGFVILLIVVFLVLGYYSFLKGNSDFSIFTGWLRSPNVFQALLLLVFGGGLALILIKSK